MLTREIGPAASFRIFTSKRELEQLYLERLADGSARGRDGVNPRLFGQNLDSNIRLVRRRLRAGSYKFSAYRENLKSKGAGKPPRVIAIPTVRDRLVLGAMARVLIEHFDGAMKDLPQDKIAAVTQAAMSGKYSRFLSIDIKNYYPTISHSAIERVLRQRIRSERLMTLFLDAVRSPILPPDTSSTKASYADIGVPQGLTISNAIAELVLHDLDNEMLQRSGIAFFRYVDDVLILATESSNLEALFDEYKQGLKRIGVAPHPLEGANSKSRIGLISDGFDYLGYVFAGPRVTVRPSSVARLEQRLAGVFVGHKYAVARAQSPRQISDAREMLQWRIDLVITGFVFEDRRRGWLAYFSQIRHQQLLQHLDQMVANMTLRFGVENSIRPKSFVKAYRLLARRKEDDSGYIPCFDNLNPAQMIAILQKYLRVSQVVLSRLSEVEIEQLFRKKIRGLASELELDRGAEY